MAGWFDRWVNSTRGRILSLLRSDDATVSDLAENVGVSDNAVRTHLASLQRDGLVEEAGTTHEGGVGKPAQLFRATAHGEELFPKAYAAVLGHVLRTVAEQEGEEGLVALLENVGRRVGHLDRPNGRPEDRVEATAQLLRALGGDIDIVPQADGSWMLEGNGCPLSAVVRDQAAVCTLIEALAAEATGEAVTQCCQHGDRPRCSFRIEKPGGRN